MEVLAAVILLLNLAQVFGLECYSCQYSEGQDSTCKTNPAGITGGTVACGPDDVCLVKNIIKKVDDVTFSFNRGCILKTDPQAIIRCVKDLNYNTCFRICATDLCNTGDGTPGSGPVDSEASGNGVASVLSLPIAVLLISSVILTALIRS